MVLARKKLDYLFKPWRMRFLAFCWLGFSLIQIQTSYLFTSSSWKKKVTKSPWCKICYGFMNGKTYQLMDPAFAEQNWGLNSWSFMVKHGSICCWNIRIILVKFSCHLGVSWSNGFLCGLIDGIGLNFVGFEVCNVIPEVLLGIQGRKRRRKFRGCSCCDPRHGQ